MAIIGQQLVVPESGWIRYDDTDENIKYTGIWTKVTKDSNTYNGTGSYINSNYATSYYEFTFYGDAFRLIDLHHTNRVASVTVTIDDIIETYSPNVSSSSVYKLLVYEKAGLSLGVHKVKVSTTATSGYFSIDAIDIPESGHICNELCNHDTSSLSFHKTLSTNLPVNVEAGKNEIHFTENGGIFINDKEGNLKQCKTGDIVKEISNPLTIEPLEYGYYFMDSDRSTSLVALTKIPLNTMKNGNMQNPIDGVIKLKANKTYEIDFDIYGIVSSNLSFRLDCFDVDTGEWLIRGGKTPVTNTENKSNVSLKGIITTKKDTNIAFLASQTFTQIWSDYTYALIKEVRNNPVNQYGGFETEVLFDGNASVSGTSYTLSDAIDNYNYIYVKADVTNVSNKTCLSTSLIIMKDDFILGDIDSYILNIANTDRGRRYLVFGFKDANNITIGSIIKYTDDINCSISKIIGIKGQLPSLLCGGEF